MYRHTFQWDNKRFWDHDYCNKCAWKHYEGLYYHILNYNDETYFNYSDKQHHKSQIMHGAYY